MTDYEFLICNLHINRIMQLLISFCNSYQSPGSVSIGVLNPDTMEFNAIKLPVEVPQTGIEGLAVSSSFLFLGLQHTFNGDLNLVFDEMEIRNTPPALLVFDRLSFKLINYYIFQKVKDVHSFLILEDESNLYVVSTGTDEVIKVKLNGSEVISEEVFWRPELTGERSDNYHLNSIYEFERDIYVSGFGKKAKGETWSLAGNGFIYNISKNKEILSGLQQPHSVTSIDGRIAFCESKAKKFRFIDSEEEIELPGYVRGLCIINNKIFVGTSARRTKSKSTGKIVDFEGLENSKCSISRISNQNFQIEQTIDLKEYANEIYEFLPITSTYLWPIYKPKNHYYQNQEAWCSKVDAALNDVKSIIPLGETFILVDNNEWGITSVPERKYLPFLEREGIYYGNPETDKVAISEIERMKQQDARYIIFGWNCFWWLDHYSEVNDYLSKYERVLKNERIIAFKLQDK